MDPAAFHDEALVGEESVGITADVSEGRIARETPASVLVTVLAINAVMFAVESTTGWLAESTALLSDSLDMLTDAAVYAVALYGAHRGRRAQARAASVAGVLQGLLALAAIAEVIRRTLMGSDPEPASMILVSFVALAANAWCLRLVRRHRDAGVHMTASWIFSQTDVLVNVSVIVGGGLVALTDLTVWDLILGAGIAALVLSSAVRILAAARAAARTLDS